ncbi:DUF1993 family protein [Sphingomonas arantia]|uniref:DUF1993 family protein n=1 Tax=Sphingomonas arantia TaxID=1460676 RepID=A0ABW4TUD2_9SPHN
MPRFYFHVIMAYAILRTQGVEIGKANNDCSKTRSPVGRVTRVID